MGSKAYSQMLQQLQQYLSQNLQQTQQAAQTESPHLAALGADATSYHKFLQGGDYKAPPGGYQLNMSPLSGMERAGRLNANYLGAGTGTAGQQPEGSYLLGHQGAQDNLAGEYANERQANLDQGAASSGKTLLGLGGLEQDRRTQAANRTREMLGTYFQAVSQKKPSFWGSLLKGGLAAAPSIIAAL